MSGDSGGTLRSSAGLWTGAAALSGGTLLTVFALLAAAQPSGCIDEECATRPERKYGALALLLVVAVLLIAFALVGLSRQATQAGVPTAWWRAGTIFLAVGVTLMVLGAAAGLFSENLPPLFVITEIGCLAVGALLIGILIVRSAILPWYASTLLILSALVLPAFNEQNWRVLFIVPFGIAWIVTGVAQIRRQPRTK